MTVDTDEQFECLVDWYEEALKLSEGLGPSDGKLEIINQWRELGANQDRTATGLSRYVLSQVIAQLARADKAGLSGPVDNEEKLKWDDSWDELIAKQLRDWS